MQAIAALNTFSCAYGTKDIAIVGVPLVVTKA
jgi:hypothetical protein